MLVVDKPIAPRVDKSHSTAAPKNSRKGYFYLGLLLVLLFALINVVDWRWAWLSRLQADDLYKQLSGFVIITYLAHQWHCSVLRNKGLMRQACRILNRHKWLGSLAPLVFYLHSQTLGFGYLQVLSLVYFAVFLTGLFNVETTRIHKPWFQPLWVTVHVSLSTGLLFLLGYHIYISYAYQ